MHGEDDQLLLIDALVTNDAGGAIERQEARGQQALLHGSILPLDGTLEGGPSTGVGRSNQEAMEALGFSFGEREDDLFVRVSFPEGWRMVATSHSLHSDLLDDKGIRRAGVLYKAASYDRYATIFWVCRYRHETWHAPSPWMPEDYEGTPDRCDLVRDMATEGVLFASSPYPYPYRRDDAARDAAYALRVVADREAEERLASCAVDPRNPFEGWD